MLSKNYCHRAFLFLTGAEASFIKSNSNLQRLFRLSFYKYPRIFHKNSCSLDCRKKKALRIFRHPKNHWNVNSLSFSLNSEKFFWKVSFDSTAFNLFLHEGLINKIFWNFQLQTNLWNFNSFILKFWICWGQKLTETWDLSDYKMSKFSKLGHRQMSS